MLKLNKTDMAILRALQKDARQSNEEVGRGAGVKRDGSVVSRRVAELVKARIITGMHAAIDPAKLGLVTTVYTLVTLKAHTPDLTDPFERELEAMPNVIEWSRISGSWDYLVKFLVKDTPQHDRLHAQLLRLPMVSRLRGMHGKGQPFVKPVPLENDGQG